MAETRAFSSTRSAGGGGSGAGAGVGVGWSIITVVLLDSS